jgi:predicted nucleic acid-binding protein
MLRLVLDSSVVIAAAQPDEPAHADARTFLDALRRAEPDQVRLFGPAELWLETHVVEQRLARSRRSSAPPAGALSGLVIELVSPDRVEVVTVFLDLLARRMRGRKPSANATDLVYLWAAHEVGATVVTLDRGLLGYHGVVCDVTRPQHVRLGR